MRYGFLLTVSFFKEKTFTSLVSIDEGVLIVTLTSLPSCESLAELAIARVHRNVLFSRL